jgi:hypothetical protein
MDANSTRFPISKQPLRCLTALLCVALILPGESLVWGTWQEAKPAPAAEQAAPPIPPAQLDSLVAPIALYPDPLLAQVLAASTYPLEIIQLQQWLAKNPTLKDKALTDAVMKQPWDPSVQAMAVLPDVTKRLADDIQWTTDLGNAFLAQRSDVMDAVQRMRKKAQDQGNLKSTEQQKVETQVVESKQVIVVQQSNPEVIYVPTYNPVVVYGPPVYPYPPIYYPPPPPAGYVAAGMAISFGVGMMVGAAYHGGWGYGCGWGHGDVDININNNFNRNTNIQGGNRVNNVGSGNTSFQHNPQHRGGAPYSNSATANKYGGTTRGNSGAGQANRAQAGTMDRSGAGANRSGGSAGVSSMDRSGAGANRSGGGAGVSSMDRGGGGGGNTIGNRSVSPSSSSRGNSAFGGASSGASARSSSSRGSSSMRGGGGGGGGRRR